MPVNLVCPNLKCKTMLSVAEARSLFAQMNGTPRLMADALAAPQG